MSYINLLLRYNLYTVVSTNIRNLRNFRVSNKSIPYQSVANIIYFANMQLILYCNTSILR